MTHSDTDAFWTLVREFDTAMVVTRDGGALRARPMAPRIPKAGGEIRFLTERPSHKVEEIEADSSVAATFSKHGRYLSVSGTARILTDRASVAEIWDAEAEAWLPQGKDDPSVVVLSIDPHMAEIWDVKANKVTQAYEFAKAYLGGQDRPDVGENRKIDL
ncbi:pyridoxamine 5'-phosphate oxidase family protein [Aurantimonas sp. Leaf443]|uniref:pyridoxamine 5'-phosphate oxidase family protein n=1 Tax=Aurantimonas sp. Leaf443 TaxID=1736378 RepID=UPI0006F724E6|nr:pyridoxamine 5'-phosphate oxidase family protein [Aurantimonas sp. Leaf443]KQT83968.1 pyridoxamine oxidase [Aurantimonas sp. Leaf443]